MKKGIFCALALVGAMATSCSDHDNVYDPDYSKKQYEANWKEVFGEVNPNQTWNMARAVKANISVDEDATVGLYTLTNGIPYQLGEYTLKAGSASFTVDVPQGTKEVYVVKDGKSGHNEVLATVSGDAISAEFASSRAEAVAASSQAGEPQYILQARSKLEIDNLSIYTDAGFTGEYYASATEWTDEEGLTDESGAPLKKAKFFKFDGLANQYRFVANVVKTIMESENTISLEEYTGELQGLVKQDGPVALTYVGGQTSANSAVGYFYTKTSDPSVDEIKTLPKYILIPGTKACNQGDKFWLTYYGENGDEAPQANFPEGTYIHFFLLRGNSGNNLNATTLKNGVPWSINGHVQLFAEEDESLNEIAGNAIGYWFQNASIIAGFSATGRAVSISNVNVLSFEDWLEEGSVDWNDFAFLLEGNFEKFEPIEKELAWTLAYEDLGSTDDFDFNDVVLRIKNITLTEGTETTKSTVQVSLVAAGGIYPAEVLYKGESICKEVHDELGAPSSAMINTGSGEEKDPVVITTFEEKDFSIAKDGKEFSIVVTKPDGTTTEVTVPQQGGTAPQAICVLGDWSWPTERTRIDKAYPDFGEWGQNYNAETDWFLHPTEEADKIYGK